MDELKRERKTISSEKGEVKENYIEDIANFFVAVLATQPSWKQSPQDCCAG